MSKYLITTADGLSFEIGLDQLEQLNIVENADGSFHLIYENRSFNIEVLESDYLGKRYVLNINEKEIALSLKDELDLAIEKMGFSTRSASSGGTILSPMPGLVIKIARAVGDKVVKGDMLLILEAMKMENIIKAPADGVVESIFVVEGDTVAKKQKLIEIR